MKMPIFALYSFFTPDGTMFFIPTVSYRARTPFSYTAIDLCFLNIVIKFVIK